MRHASAWILRLADEAHLGSVNGINAVWLVPADAPWREPMSALLADLRVEEAATNLVLEFLDRRVRGAIDWREQLDGAVLPNGRPAPPVRLYNDRLRGGRTDTAADALPMVAVGPLIAAFEFWGAGELAGEPGTLGFESVDDHVRTARFGEAFPAVRAAGRHEGQR
ncbi:MAG: hypothetical protein R6W77_13190 [Trueperaceae bacterium]